MRRTNRAFWMIACAVALAACSAHTASPPSSDAVGSILYDGPLDGLAPFRHGNSYVYTIAGSEDAERRIESRCSVAGSRVFLTVHQDDTVLARTEMIADEHELRIVSEVSPKHDFAFTYDPPVTVLTTPLRAGIQRTRARLRAWRPSDGSPLGEGTVEVAWSAHPAPSGMTDASFEIRTVKQIEMDNGHKSRLHSKRWLAPGVGEISSTGTAGDGRMEFRELKCAQIGERAFGDCGEPIVRSQ